MFQSDRRDINLELGLDFSRISGRAPGITELEFDSLVDFAQQQGWQVGKSKYHSEKAVVCFVDDHSPDRTREIIAQLRVVRDIFPFQLLTVEGFIAFPNTEKQSLLDETLQANTKVVTPEEIPGLSDICKIENRKRCIPQFEDIDIYNQLFSSGDYVALPFETSIKDCVITQLAFQTQMYCVDMIQEMRNGAFTIVAFRGHPMPNYQTFLDAERYAENFCNNYPTLQDFVAITKYSGNTDISIIQATDENYNGLIQLSRSIQGVLEYYCGQRNLWGMDNHCTVMWHNQVNLSAAVNGSAHFTSKRNPIPSVLDDKSITYLTLEPKVTRSKVALPI